MSFWFAIAASHAQEFYTQLGELLKSTSWNCEVSSGLGRVVDQYAKVPFLTCTLDHAGLQQLCTMKLDCQRTHCRSSSGELVRSLMRLKPHMFECEAAQLLSVRMVNRACMLADGMVDEALDQLLNALQYVAEAAHNSYQVSAVTD